MAVLRSDWSFAPSYVVLPRNVLQRLEPFEKHLRPHVPANLVAVDVVDGQKWTQRQRCRLYLLCGVREKLVAKPLHRDALHSRP
jgi:hypothetical protein